MKENWKTNPDVRNPGRMPADEFLRRLRATQELLDRISVETGPYRRESIRDAALRTAIFMRDYIKRNHVVRIRRERARPMLIPAPGSSVGVLRRMRHAVERDNPYTFLRAHEELPDQVHRRLSAICRNHEEGSVRVFDPWMMLFLKGPIRAAYGKSIPPKDECLRALDSAIAEARRPGRREDTFRQNLVVEVILCWARRTESDLREPRYENGTSRRRGALADFIRELEDIWNVRLVSTNSGASMRKAILDARRELGD
jgi:hypothetical protein